MSSIKVLATVGAIVTTNSHDYSSLLYRVINQYVKEDSVDLEFEQVIEKVNSQSPQMIDDLLWRTKYHIVLKGLLADAGLSVRAYDNKAKSYGLREISFS